ncbi:hypothetical protein BSKO_01813 [Bryopsis sp. KO-2023]|nr:hypothetical protein BSKO_01813 [Bryopsis sp. KO-2023]
MERPKRHHESNKRSMTKEKSLEERRRRSAALTHERRDALLRSKRLRRDFDVAAAGPVDAQIAKLNRATLGTAVVRAVEQATASQDTDCQKHLEDIRYLRKLLTESGDPPFQEVLDAGAVPLLGRAIEGESKSTTKAVAQETTVEAVWALAYLAGGAHHIAEAVLPQSSSFILRLSGHSGWTVAEVCAWALGNLGADCEQFADTLVAQGVVKPLAECVFGAEKGVRGEAGREVVVAGVTSAWALSNMVRNSHVAGDQLLGLPCATEKIVSMLGLGDVKLVSEILWLVIYIIARNARNLEHMVQAGLGPPMVKVLIEAVKGLEHDLSNAMMVLIPALRGMGNVVAGASPEYVATLLECENGLFVKALVMCLKSSHRGIQKESAWALSNIAGCPTKTGAELVVQAEAVPVLMELIRSAAFDVRKEAAFVMANLCMRSQSEPNLEFLQQALRSPKFLATFMQFMRSPDMEAARLGIQFTEMVLRVVPGGLEMVEEVDGIDALEAVQFGNAPAELQRMAARLVDTYYGEGYGLE